MIFTRNSVRRSSLAAILAVLITVCTLFAPFATMSVAAETVKTVGEAALTTLSDGDLIIIENVKTTGKYLTSQTEMYSGKTCLKLTSSKDEAAVWTIEKYNNKFYVKSEDGKYLTVEKNSASLTAARSAVISALSGKSYWDIAKGSYHLNNVNSAGERARGSSSSGSLTRASGWYVYSVTYTEIEPEVPEEPVEPEEPVTPTEPEEPVTPTEPEEPVTPSEPEEPVTPTEPEEPVTPSEPEEPVTPTEPEEPVTPTEPEEPVTPTEPEEPVTPTEPEEPETPSEPEEPVTPSEPEVSVLVVAGSDFQDPDSSVQQWYVHTGNYAPQVARLEAIMTNIRSAYGNAYGFFAGGDYNFDGNSRSASVSRTGISEVKGAVSDVFGDGVDTVFVQGNHDAKNLSDVSDFRTCGVNGENDTEYYGVFVLNETEYRSYPESSSKWPNESNVKATSQAKARALADNLDTYLSAKAEAGYDKPIFVLTHVPLHYSTRTKSESDCIFATYFVDVMNTYGDSLNIIFLYGHNHAWGDDDYLGGSSVYLTRGDMLNVAVEGDKSSYVQKEIKFTYMNYGYTGYYWDKWVTTPSQIVYSNADNTLTMTSFLITGNEVTISRWDENGEHEVLKAAGAASKGCRDNGATKEVCTPDTSVVYAPQLKVFVPVAPMTMQSFTDLATGINLSVKSYETAVLNVSASASCSAADALGLSSYTLYNISLSEFSGAATVTIPVSASVDSVWYLANGALTKIEDAVIAGGAAVFASNRFDAIVVGDSSSIPTGPVIGTTPVTSLKNGDVVVIENVKSAGKYLTSTVEVVSRKNTLKLTSDIDSAEFWTVEIYNGSTYLKNSAGKYLTVESGAANIVSTRSAKANLISGKAYFNIVKGKYYLTNQNSTGTRAVGSTSSGSSTTASAWNFYLVTE